MSEGEFLGRLKKLGLWEGGGRRAPYKPLLLLLALGRVQAQQPRVVPFSELEKPLAALFKEFGPPWQTTALYPFWYLQTDGLWEIPDRNALEMRVGKSEPKVSSLRAHARGGFPKPVDDALRGKPEFLVRAARLLLDRHFEPSLHTGIATTCGLDLAAGAPWLRLRPRETAPSGKPSSRPTSTAVPPVAGASIWQAPRSAWRRHTSTGTPMEGLTTFRTDSAFVRFTTSHLIGARSASTPRGTCWCRSTCTEVRAWRRGFVP